MATMSTIQRMTYEEYLASPETVQRYDIIDGEMIMSPAPTSDHQWISFRIARALQDHVEPHKLGVVLYAPVDVLIRRDPLRVRQPDVLFLSAARTGITGREGLRQMPIITVPPDLVVEILSPTETRLDIEEKLADYRSIGVLESWLVSPETQTVEVLRLSSEKMETVAVFGMGQSVRSEVLPELTLTVAEVFA
ncbi:MAG: Uma2 family endonuclease [Candidatus Latescibacteria bacterium]|nr:Uma2 family endonuclease [Candidatus Latescibacterota bacterium]